VSWEQHNIFSSVVGSDRLPDLSEMSWLGLSPGKVLYLRGMLAGSSLMYLVLLATGNCNLVFGPERKAWSQRMEDDEEARRRLEELEKDPKLFRHRWRPSSRNYIEVYSSTPERRIMQRLFLDLSMSRLEGIIKFGADCEGPPRSVHGGCTAAVVDAIVVS